MMNYLQKHIYFIRTSIQKSMRTQSGFTLLFAVLVSSLVLAIGLSIANLTLKEIQLSGAGRESQFAFYAADTGAECALYWDIQGSIFATSSESIAPTGPFPCVNEDIVTGDASGTQQTLTVDGVSAPAWTYIQDSSGSPDEPGAAATSSFEILFNPQGYCAIVQVGKYTDDAGTHTTIDSRGYNTCDPSSSLRTERGLQVTY